MLTRESFLSPPALPSERVDLPELGGHVYIRTLTAGELDAFELSVLSDKSDWRAKFVVRCACDEKGGRLFQDADAAILTAHRADVIDRMFSVASRLNARTRHDEDELLKNSDSGPAGDSYSA
jgi:hypothetical protein